MSHSAGHYMTYADVFQPSSRYYSLLYDTILIVGFSFILALSATIAIPLPFSPVPITFQTLAVLLSGMLLGSKRGFFCVLTYISEGALGFPVFAGGSSGLAYMVGPTGGYLIGFLFASYITGLLAENGWDRKILTSIIAMSIGDVVTFMFGLSWLSFLIDVKQVFSLGLYPFIPGEILKIVIASLILPIGWKWFRRLEERKS